MKFCSDALRKWVMATSRQAAVAWSAAANAAASMLSRSCEKRSGIGIRMACSAKAPLGEALISGWVSNSPLGNSATLPVRWPALSSSTSVVANMSISTTRPRN